MSVEYYWYDTERGNQSAHPSAPFSTDNSTWSCLGLNPGLLDERWTTNHPSQTQPCSEY